MVRMGAEFRPPPPTLFSWLCILRVQGCLNKHLGMPPTFEKKRMRDASLGIDLKRFYSF